MSTPTATDARSTSGALGNDVSRAPRRGRQLSISAAAVAAAAGTYLVVDSGVLRGFLGLVPLLILIVAVPSHRLLVRRVSVNVALVLGWSPVLWWMDWPVRVNHAALLVAVGVAALATARMRGIPLKPACTPPEALMLAGAPLVAGAAVWRWLASGTPQGALELLVPGFDNWAHFGMFWSLRNHGAVLDAIGPAPDGAEWRPYVDYPQGFHSVIGTLSELLSPSLTDGTEALPVYLHAQALLVVLGVLLVTASMLSLTGLRDRPMVALPAVALVCTAFVWEPGQKIFADGFLSFWLAAVAAVAALLIAVAQPRPTLVDVAAVAGLILLVCHAWLPLALLVAPAGLLVLIPYVGRGRSRRRAAAAVAVLGVGALGSLKAVLDVFDLKSMNDVVDQNGGYNAPPLVPLLVLTLAGFFVLLSFGSVTLQRPGQLPLLLKRQRLLLFSSLLVGLAMLGVLAVAQVRRNGTTSYYFVKLLLGYDLVVVALVSAVVAVCVVSRFAPGGRRLARVGTSVALTLAATMAFGVVTPGEARLFDDGDPGTASIAGPYSRRDLAAGVLAAKEITGDRASFDSVYLALGPGNAGLLLYPDAWLHAIHSAMSARVMVREETMRLKASTPAEAAPVVAAMLEAEPNLVFLVPEASAADLRDALPASLAAHIVTIPGTED